MEYFNNWKRQGMKNSSAFDALFQRAVLAIDAGDEKELRDLLDEHPELATQRLTAPGEWLTGSIGDALKHFFKDPYLLWFVSEDAVRNKILPSNIASIASIIIGIAKKENPSGIKEQLDYGLKLVAWSSVARECGVQIALLDVMIDAGAAINGVSNDALVNGNFEAAEHLINRGAGMTLATALLLGKWEEAEQLAAVASPDQKQFSFILSALNGKAEAVSRALSYGADINKPSKDLYSHATALHHAVYSGSMETVKVLVEAGADMAIRDSLWDGTPLGWAEYGGQDAIAEYLKEQR
jgi:hypothetical protein